MYKYFCLTVCVVVIGVSCAHMACAAPAPSGFGDFATHGLTLTPSEFNSGELVYSLALSSGACVLSDGIEYPITHVWGFFAVNRSADASNDFTAAGSDLGQWVWSQNPQHGGSLNVGGWQNSSKKDALVRPLTGSMSKQFAFDQFSFTGATPTLGLHATVSIPEGAASPFPGGGVTSSLIPTPVPEPASVSALLAGALAIGGMALRRRK